MKKTHAKSRIERNWGKDLNNIESARVILQMETTPPHGNNLPSFIVEHIGRGDYEAPHYTIEEMIGMGWVSPEIYTADMERFQNDVVDAESRATQQNEYLGDEIDKYVRLFEYMKTLVFLDHPNVDRPGFSNLMDAVYRDEDVIDEEKLHMLMQLEEDIPVYKRPSFGDE